MENINRTLPAPLIPRQERFCQAYVHYGAGATAASAAGYAPQSAKRQGWRLLRSPRIQARIREIQAELADHRERVDDAIVGKLEVVYRRALEEHQFYAAARAAELQGKFLRRRGDADAGEAARDAPSKKTKMDTLGTPLDSGSQKPSQRCPSRDAPVSKASRPVAGRG